MHQKSNLKKINLIPVFILLFSLIPSVLFAFCYEEAGKEYNINPSLLLAISETESDMNPTSVNTNSNNTQDIGLMQINSTWIKSLDLDFDLLLSDPCYNLRTGAHILRRCIDRYGYVWQAIGCYNAVTKNQQIKYSWKIYNKLKAEKEVKKIRSLEDKNFSASQLQNLSTSQSPNSEFYFNIKDKPVGTP